MRASRIVLLSVLAAAVAPRALVAQEVELAEAESSPEASPPPEAAGTEGEALGAADGAAGAEEIDAEAFFAEFEASLQYRSGDVVVGDGLATLALGDRFRYLGPEDTDRVLQLWGNPPQPDTLGMVVPGSLSPLDEEGWGVIVAFTADGYVDDDDAEDIDYEELLDQMREDSQEANSERESLGLPTYDLIGWAEPPHYDADSHKLYWAKELDFGDGEHVLNYAIRALGRRGVLEMNAVGSMSQLALLRGEMGQLLENVRFETGHRYADFDPDVDEVAAYGIGALIAGKLAAKTGLFAGLLALLIKLKKLLIVAVIGIGALVKRLLGGRSAEPDTAADDGGAPEA